MHVKQLGVTLLELILVLAIIAAILLGVTRLYQVVENNRKVTEAANMVLQTYQAAAQYEVLPTGRANLLIDFYSRGYLTKNFIERNSNPWGGDIEALRVSGSKMRVLLTKMPGDLCENLKSKFNKMENAKVEACPAINKIGEFKITFSMDQSS